MNIHVDKVLNAMYFCKPFPSHLWTNGIMSFSILDDAKCMHQRNGETVFEHTMNVLDGLQEQNSITMLAALFHDLGKLTTRTCVDNKVYFWNHELASVVMAQEMLTLWKAPQQLIKDVVPIIKTHMMDLKSNITKGKIRRFIADIGVHNIDNWFIVRRSDAFSYNKRKMKPKEYVDFIIAPFEKRVREELGQMNHNDIKFDITSLTSDSGIQISGE